MRRLRPILPHPTDPSLALIPLTQGFFATISVVDAAVVGQFNWFAQKDKVTVYARRASHQPDGSTVILSLHREIAVLAAISIDKEIDHINGNGLDCRRSNLRAASHAQNMRNAARRRDNTSGVKGVSWSPKRNKWVGRVRLDGKRFYAGFFESIEEAAAAVLAARIQLHGEFAEEGGRN